MPDDSIKLSAAQKEVISKLRDGDILHYPPGAEPRCFFKGNFYKTISWATLLNLERHNLIVREGRYFELTVIGRTIKLK